LTDQRYLNVLHQGNQKPEPNNITRVKRERRKDQPELGRG